MNAKNSAGELIIHPKMKHPKLGKRNSIEDELQHLDLLMGSLNGQMDDIEGHLDSHKQELLQTLNELKEARQQREEAAKTKDDMKEGQSSE